MNYAFYILPVLLAVSIPSAFAEIVETKGQNYDLVENYFTGEAVWTSHPERIMDGGWQNYALSNTGDKVIFNTNSVGSFVFDKNSCSYSIYGNGYNGEQIIPSVSAVATYLNNGQWQNLPINDEVCTVTVDRYEDGVFLKSTKVITEDVTEDVFIPYTGTTENFYVNATNANFDLVQSSNGTNIGYYNGETRVLESVEVEKFVQEIRLDINSGFKETFKVWHSGSEELGISQTVHTGESITIGEQTINIAQLNGQSFDRQFIIDNEAEILQLTDSINYDFDIGIESLTTINIIHESSFFDNTYKVNMDFASGDFVGYLEIDPTVTIGASTSAYHYDGNNNGLCDVYYATQINNSFYAGMIGSGSVYDCYVSDFAFDISSVSTDAINDIASVTLELQTGTSFSPESIDIVSIDFDDLGSRTNAQRFSSILSGTEYVNSYTMTSSTLESFDLTSAISSDLSSAIGTDTYFSFGVRGNDLTQTGSSEWTQFDSHTGTNPPSLEIVYPIPTAPQPPTGLTTVAGVPVELDWTAPTDNGGSAITGYKVFRTDNEYADTELPDNSANSAGIDFTNNEFLLHGVESVTSIDSSLDGTNTGGTTGQTGKINNAWDFSASDYVTISDDERLRGLSEMSLNFWVKANSISGVDFITSGTSVENFKVRMGGSGEVFFYADGIGNRVDTPASSITTSGFKMITIVYDGSGSTNTDKVKIYVNNVLSSSNGNGAIPSSIPNNVKDIILAGDGANIILDEFVFYDKALTSSEVSALYNSGSGTSTPDTDGMIAHYNFEQTGNTLENQGTITTTSIPDKSTNSITVTQTNPSTSTTGVIGTGIQDPEFTFTDSNLPDNTDDFSIGSWVKLDGTPTNTKLLSLNDVRFHVGTTSASVVELQDFTAWGTVTTNDITEASFNGASWSVYTGGYSWYPSSYYSSSPSITITNNDKIRLDTTGSGWTNGMGAVENTDLGTILNDNENWSLDYKLYTSGSYEGAFLQLKHDDGTWTECHVSSGHTYDRNMQISIGLASTSNYVAKNSVVLSGVTGLHECNITRTGNTYTVTGDNGVGTITGTVTSGIDTVVVTNNRYNTASSGNQYIEITDLTINDYPSSTIISAIGLDDNTSSPQHYTFVRDGNDWEIYQNGVSEATATDSTSLGSNTGQDYTTHIDGMIDEYFINSDTLTSSEVNMVYEKGSEPTQIDTTGASVTEYDDSNVTGGTEYYYTVKATNAIGDSDLLTPFVSGLAGTPPGNPTGLTSNIQDTNNAPLDVFLQWSSPVSWGSGTAQGFEVYRNGVLVTTTGLINSYTDTVTAGTHSHYVKAVSTHGASGNSNTVNITTPTVPDAITDLSGSVISDTQINVTWTAPNDGGSNIDLYKIFKDGSQIDTTTNTNYSLTGLTPNTSYTITVYSNNSVGDSLVSNTENLTTYQSVSGSMTVTPNTQGATTQLTFSVSNITGTPTPNFNTFTLKEGITVIASGITSPYNLALNDDSSHTYTVTSTDNTHWDTPTITGSTTVTASYDPTWSNGVSYNYTRTSGVIDLTINRDSQSLWDATCNYKTTAQVMADQTGIVSNHTNVWYINDSQNIADIDTVYVSCSEDGTKLFSFTSFGPNRLGGGIAQLDDIFGDMTGTPVALIFVLLVAGLFTGRSAPTGILLVLALIGVLGFIGMLTIDEAVWGFLLLAGVLGIFLGKRFL